MPKRCLAHHTFEERLKRLWHPEVDLTAIYELAPLRKADVEIAAKASSVDGAKLIEEVVNKEVTSFAVSPITLQFLLGICKEHGGVGPSPWTKRVGIKQFTQILSSAHAYEVLPPAKVSLPKVRARLCSL